MGIGGLPNAILGSLAGRKDLGVHTEVFTDNLVPLIESGVITGAKKTLNPGKIVAAFLQGSKEFYRYVDHNELLMMKPVDYTNNIGIIGQHEHMVAVNAALEVDLWDKLLLTALVTVNSVALAVSSISCGAP